MTDSAGHFYEFGPFRVDVTNLLLFRDGQPLSLAPKAVETLIALVQHGGQLVKKDDLIRIVWSDRIVDESNLSQNIYLLRKTLGDGSNGQSYIETVPRRGYRFTGEVRECNAAATDLILAGRTEIQRVRESPDAIIEQSDSRSLDYRSSHTTRSLNRGWRLMVFLAGVAVLTLATLSYFAFFRRPRISETKAASSKTQVGAVSEGFSEQHLTANSDAYRAYIQGRYYWGKQTTPALEQAIQQYQEALRYDPNYALPYAGLAEAYALLGSHYDSTGLTPSDAMSKAKATAVKSIEMNDAVAETHTALGAIMERYDWDWPGAEKEFKRAIELNPNDAETHRIYSSYLLGLDRFDEAILEVRRAQQLDPLSLFTSVNVGWTFYFVRQYDRAVEQCQQALELDANSDGAHACLGQSYRAKGMREQAISESERAVALSGGAPPRVVGLAWAYAEFGKRAEANKLLEELRERARHGYVSPYHFAMIYAALGDQQQALAALDQGYAERDRYLTWLRVDDAFDPLHKDPHFQDLLRRIGFPP